MLALSLHDQGGAGGGGSGTSQAGAWGDTASFGAGRQGGAWNSAAQQSQGPTHSASPPAPAPAAPNVNASAGVPPPVTRVRALYDFMPGEQGELGFHAGDVLRVLNTAYEHWWKAELRGEVGIVPVNHLVRITSAP